MLGPLRFATVSPKFVEVPFGWASRIVYGGPYHMKPARMAGIKLAPEVEGDAWWHLPIRDFSVPPVKHTVDEVLRGTISLMTENKQPVYVGCYGGRGRTGLFLAVLCKVMGVPDPIAYVRKHFDTHAVETEIQKRYVEQYISPFTARDLFIYKAVAFYHGRNSIV
jgi:hypothetical protein